MKFLPKAISVSIGALVTSGGLSFYAHVILGLQESAQQSHSESSDVYIGDVKNGTGTCNLLISGELTLITLQFYWFFSKSGIQLALRNYISSRYLSMYVNVDTNIDCGGSKFNSAAAWENE